MDHTRTLLTRTSAPLLALTLASVSCTEDGSGETETDAASSTSSTSGPATSGRTTTASTGAASTGTSGSTDAETSSSNETSTSGTDETGSSSTSGSGGSTSTGPAPGTFDEARSYEAFWTSSKEHCAQQMKQGVNCSYLVSFCPDGRSAVVWTDIVGDGTYALDGTTIEAQWSDVRFSPVDFEYDPESDTLLDSVFSETWERTLESSLIDCD